MPKIERNKCETLMQLCVALDLPTKEGNLELLKKLKGISYLWVKVGFRSYIRDGKELLEEIKKINPDFKIFLDLKLHDIPNTMADAAEEIANFGLVDMFNVHASSGYKAMCEVMDRIKDIDNKPLVIAVTALTSFDNDSFKVIYNEDIDTKAINMAKDANDAGLDGVVCSAFESLEIKEATFYGLKTICPGIRPYGEDSGDQKRVANLDLAKENQCDFIVVGRPIYQADYPAGIVKMILAGIK